MPEDMLHPHDAANLARELMRRHGLVGWRFQFDHARRRFITLSRPLVLLNGEDEVRDTILHEIAHALTPGDGHGPKWKAKCAEIGARPARCYADDAVASPPRRPARYRLGCRPCGWWVDRRRFGGQRYRCATCGTALVFEEKVMVG